MVSTLFTQSRPDVADSRQMIWVAGAFDRTTDTQADGCTNCPGNYQISELTGVDNMYFIFCVYKFM